MHICLKNIPSVQEIWTDGYLLVAESGGFEPSIRLRVYRISSAALSTTQTTFLLSAAKVLLFSYIYKHFYKNLYYEFRLYILFSKCNAPVIVFTCSTVAKIRPVFFPWRSFSSTSLHRCGRE